MRSKGIAEMVAVMLVIAIAIGVSLFLGFYFGAFTKEQTGEISEKLNQTGCTEARIQFGSDDILLNKTDVGYANITVFNKGRVGLYNFSLFTFKAGDTVELNITSSTQKNQDDQLEPGEIHRIESTGNTTGTIKLRLVPGNCPLSFHEVEV